MTAVWALVGKIVSGLVRSRQKEAPKNDEIESSHWSNFMSYLPQVIEARQISGFIVSARFDDGTEKRIDVSQWFKGPVFGPLKDLKLFKKFFIEAGTLAWPNGVDIAPEALYAARDSIDKKHNKRAERTWKTYPSS